MSPTRKAKTCVIYARLSVSRDENSVSIDRQIEAAQAYAKARGWTVLETFVDDGVSATHNKPEARRGWSDLLAYEDRFDAVIVWKVDRLARRVLDFLHADEALQGRGAGIVCVEDPVDMTTAQGRAFAVMLSVFAELEAQTISGRVKGAQAHLLKAGRWKGGATPYGFRAIKNPAGPGYVLDQDPETIGYVKEAVRQILDGRTIYAVQKWLDEVEAPVPTMSVKNRKRPGWVHATVQNMVTNPILAGMRAVGDDVLRDDNGMPVINPALAIITTEQRRQVLDLLENRDDPRRKPVALRGSTSPLLSGLVTCGHCDRVMVRGTAGGSRANPGQARPALTCKGCHMTLAMAQFTEYLVSRLLDERGDLPVIEWDEKGGDNAAELADIEEAMRRVSAQLTEDDADVPALLEQLAALKELRTTARTARPKVRSWTVTTQTVGQEWQACEDDDARRRVLNREIGSLVVTRGGRGRYFDPGRVQLTWKDHQGVSVNRPRGLPDPVAEAS